MTDEAISGLGEFGLSMYEARAYVTLLRQGTLPASELAHHAGLPRTKVYSTVSKLMRKGLATVSRAKSITYSAVQPAKALGGATKEQEARAQSMERLVSELAGIGEQGAKSRGAKELVYFELDWRLAPERLAEMILVSKRSIMASVGKRGLELFAGCKAQLVSAMRDGLEIRIIIPDSLVGSKVLGEIPGGAAVRAATGVHECIIFDGTDVLAIGEKCEVFPSATALAACQFEILEGVWRNSIRVDSLAGMRRAQNICRMIRALEDATSHIFEAHAANTSPDLAGMLERLGVGLPKYTGGAVSAVDAALQALCGGSAVLDSKAQSIIMESPDGTLLPWAALLEGYLRKADLAAGITHQKISGGGRRVHIKLAKGASVMRSHP